MVSTTYSPNKYFLKKFVQTWLYFHEHLISLVNVMLKKKMLKKVDIKKFHYRNFLENVVSEIRDNFQESTYDRVDLD